MNTTEKHTLSNENQEPDDFFIPDLCNAKSVMVLVIASELFALIVAVVESPLPDFDWSSFALISLLVQWVCLSSAALICSLRPWLRNLPSTSVLMLCLGIVLLDTAIFSILGEWFMMPNFRALGIEFKVDFWLVFQHLLISAIISGMVFRYFLVQHQLRVKERSELTARLQSLQSRIRPHFLFNSMNIIASLIATDPETAETVVEDLSELFRASLKETANVVPLETEIELCKKYARIEKLRLGKRLSVKWDEKNFDSILYKEIEIPMLLLQPLLENAIYHGIQPRAEGGEVNIQLESGDEHFQITMTNPLPAASFHTSAAKQSKGNKMALENIRHRLAAIYGDKGKLEQHQENEQFVTVLSFPKKANAYDAQQGNHI